MVSMYKSEMSLKLTNHRSLILGITLLLSPLSALAGYEVNITNYNDSPIEIKHGDHECIHDPGYFDKTVPAQGDITVTAKWINSCHPRYIKICRGDTKKCTKIQSDKEYDKAIFLFEDGSIGPKVFP